MVEWRAKIFSTNKLNVEELKPSASQPELERLRSNASLGATCPWFVDVVRSQNVALDATPLYLISSFHTGRDPNSGAGNGPDLQKGGLMSLYSQLETTHTTIHQCLARLSSPKWTHLLSSPRVEQDWCVQSRLFLGKLPLHGLTSNTYWHTVV